MKRLAVLVFVLLLENVLAAQSSIRWRPWAQGGRQGSSVRAATKRLSPLRTHLALEFAAPPSASDLALLRSRGAVVVGALSDRAVVVSAPPGFTTAGLSVSFTGAFTPVDKISPRIRRPVRASYYVIEFYPDVDMADARTIATQCGLRVIENPDLLPNDLLVRGSASALANLSNWDEVEYIFPASPNLAQGVPVNACAGALTSAGQVSTGVPTIGDGWDGPGLDPATLNYAFRTVTEKVPADSAKSEVVRAFSEWTKYAKLTFLPTDSASATRTITVLFATGAHGDGYPFDGPGGTISHTFYPYPLNPEPIAGDMHLDDAENWRIGADTDLFSVALHETGHALGLGHSDNPADVMYPYYRRVGGLSAGDIAAVRELYAPQGAENPNTGTANPDGTNPTPPPLALTVQSVPEIVVAEFLTISGAVTGGNGDVQVSWRNGIAAGAASGSRNWTATIPLAMGWNTIAISARDAQLNTTSATVGITRQAPAPATTIRILQPSSSGAYTASTKVITISGTATDASGVDHVSWIDSRGASGNAAGTTTWNTPPIALFDGANVITVSAYGIDGGSAAQTITITYASPPPPPPPDPSPTDNTPPTLTIISPAGTNVATTATSVVFSGTASDNAGVAAVTWSSSTGASGTATGTTNWTTAPITLLVGTNMITIHAYDAAGNSAWRAVMVTRSGT